MRDLVRETRNKYNKAKQDLHDLERNLVEKVLGKIDRLESFRIPYNPVIDYEILDITIKYNVIKITYRLWELDYMEGSYNFSESPETVDFYDLEKTIRDQVIDQLITVYEKE